MEVIYTKVDQISCSNCQQVIDVTGRAPFTKLKCPHCNSQLAVPALLGNFLLVEQLGAGGMGAVYRAVDQALGRFVAIKVMKKSLGDDNTLVESFLREARSAAALNHRNIVQIYSCGEVSGQPYIAMELVSGGRMDQMMEAGEPLEEARLLVIALDVAEGLKAANEIGLVHGDIKPANILFDKSGTAKIVDFGLAQFVNRQQERGEIWGTPYYISPERARGGAADHRSDIYSLGATMYHALTAQPPFEGNTAGDVVVARLKQPPPDISELRPDLHPQTVALVNRMMASDTSLRYPTSASLLADLRDAVEVAKRGPYTPPARKKSGGKGLLLGLAAALLLGGGGLAWWLTRDRPAPVQHEVVEVVPQPPVATQAVAVVAAGVGEVFFTGDEEKALIAALQGFAGADPKAAHGQLTAFAAKLPNNSGRMLWVNVLQALALRMAGETINARIQLDSVITMPIKQERTHPLRMPQVLARYAAGDLDDRRFGLLAEDWAPWFAHLGEFVRATDHLARGERAAAAVRLKNYAGYPVTNSAPAWPYALQPAARKWAEELASFDGVTNEAARLIQAGQMAEAQAAISAYTNRVPPILRGGFDGLAATLRKAEGDAAAAKRAQNERGQREAIQRDLDLVDAGLTDQLPLLQRKEYAKAAAALKGLKPSTKEGKDALALAVNRYERLQALKDFIVAGINAQPFQQPSDLGGEVTGANAAELRMMFPGYIKGTRTWTEVSVRAMVQMGSYYAGLSKEEPAKRAERYLHLAVFCYFNGGLEPAASFAQEAVKLQPAAAVTARKLMPDVLP